MQKLFFNGIEKNILCLTETHHKVERFVCNKKLEKFETMRLEPDKGGGGLQILTRKCDGLEFEKIENENRDILEIEGSCLGIDMKIILVYFDVDKGPKGIVRNKKIRENIEERIENNEKKGLIIMGDFNGHLNILEKDRKNDKNGDMVLEWMEEFNLKLMNATEKCRGTYTRIVGDQKSALDFILVNRIIYDICISLDIDERKDLTRVSDHTV